jgi:hypothetical protein
MCRLICSPASDFILHTPCPSIMQQILVCYKVRRCESQSLCNRMHISQGLGLPEGLNRATPSFILWRTISMRPTMRRAWRGLFCSLDALDHPSMLILGGHPSCLPVTQQARHPHGLTAIPSDCPSHRLRSIADC